MEEAARTSTTPSVVAVTMGYGHLRAAAALADHLGVGLERADEAPLANRAERIVWSLARHGYHTLSRLSQRGSRSTVFAPILRRLTAIPEQRGRPERPSGTVRFLDALVRLGFGAGFAPRRRHSGHRIVLFDRTLRRVHPKLIPTSSCVYAQR